ncbi:MAG: MFS transporter [Thermoanaerobaculia bacterium]
MSAPQSPVLPPPPEPRVSESRLRRTFSALRYRDFRLVWIGAFISTTGTWMQVIAQSWVVLELTGSAFYLGIDAFLSTFPMILFSLIGGAIADRIERRRILIASQILQMTFAFVLAALLFFDVAQVWHIFILSFLTGSVQAFGGPAYQALLPLVVGRREDVPNAVAMNSLQFNLARMIGPMFAAVALAAWGAAACFTINGLTFIAPIVTLMAIAPRVIPPRAASTVGADIREGLRFLQSSGTIRQLTGLAFAITFFGVPLVTLMPVIARELFGFGATGYSALMTAQGMGSVVGAFWIAGHNFRRGAGRSSVWFLVAFAGALGVFTFSRHFPVSVAAAFLAGLCLLGVVTTVSSLVQLATPEVMRGRVMSIFMLAFRGGVPLGSLAAGWAAERWGVTTALGINAVLMLIVGLTFLFGPNRIREI